MITPLPNPPAPTSISFWRRLHQTRQRLHALEVSTANVTDSSRSLPGSPRPKVSVMLITYNHEQYVAEALDSILSQERDFEIEINVIDDASTDRTQSIVSNYAGHHPGIINCYFNATNVGHIHTQLNTIRGFQTLRGEYFAILEGDDYWTDTGKLAEQVRILDQNKQYVACAHWVLKVYEDGRPSEHFFPYKGFGRNVAKLADLVRMAGVYHLSSIVYRNVFGLSPPLALADPYSCEITINMMYGMYGDFYCIDRYMSNYRVHGQGHFSGRSSEDLWLFHLHGYRHFSLYMGWRYWEIFVGAVVGFSRYVLLAPKRKIVSHLTWKAKALFWTHLLVVAPLYLYFFLKRLASALFSRSIDYASDVPEYSWRRVKDKIVERWPLALALSRMLKKTRPALRFGSVGDARSSSYSLQRLKDRIVERWPIVLVFYHRLKRKRSV
ncbi:MULTISPECIES: glycosyltransferase family 2 protein [unclassified Bradyrhizobium]|uniref:glycosyltransferase family 2 protein n=1 Tax=unclassified Bradyrhizobium TaxID=2631580 RepID=UPI0028EEDC38|nr:MULTISPECIES: glycosyltransferase [unclassified Bradyrhizobium]